MSYRKIAVALDHQGLKVRRLLERGGDESRSPCQSETYCVRGDAPQGIVVNERENVGYSLSNNPTNSSKFQFSKQPRALLRLLIAQVSANGWLVEWKCRGRPIF
jgi:hypothetical protein